MQIHNLRKLVSSGNSILHGSPKSFFEIKPSMYKDGTTAVCATVVPEIALYHALILGIPGGRKRTSPGKKDGEWSFWKQKGTPGIFTIRITPKKLEYLLLNPKLQGYIYPMDTYDFEKKGLSECRLFKSRFLREKILVTEEDLPFTPIPGHLEYKLVLPYKFESHFRIILP